MTTYADLKGLDLVALSAVAEATWGDAGIYPDSWWGQAANYWAEERPANLSDQDIAFIATFDPMVVRELLSRLRRAEAKLDAVRAIHRNNDGPNDWCTGCHASHMDEQWPCPTLAAIDPCACGCAPAMHIGEIGCQCGMPDEPPCEPGDSGA